MACGLMFAAPAAYALDLGTTISLCDVEVHGRCWVKKEVYDPYESVRFKCQVYSEDHYPQVMGAANYEIELDPKQPTYNAVFLPKAKPIHNYHSYCRKITGVAPYARVTWLRAPPLDWIPAQKPDRQSCKIKTPPPGGGGGGQTQ